MTLIHISEIHPQNWIDTSLVRSDGKLEFREKPQFGSRHAIFYKGSDWGEVHNDEYNALDFPNGTLDHLAKYTEEKTSLPKEAIKIGIIFGSLYAGYKILKFLGDELA